MATYDPQKGHPRPKPASDEPAPVDELLDVAAEDPTPEPAATPVASRSGNTTPAATAASSRSGPAKKVGVGVAITAVVFALSWAFRRKRRNAGSRSSS